VIINRAKARAAETLAFDFFCFLGFFVRLKKRMFRMGGQWPAGGRGMAERIQKRCCIFMQNNV